MKENVRIKVRGLVKYFYYFKKDYTIFRWLFTKKGFTKEFQVLNGLNFDVCDGEVVGILGANGAGKSTLLKIIASVYSPTVGSVEVVGKVSSLLELGAGFNPVLTGRENIYFKGNLLGLSRDEIDQRIDDIIEFADIGDYIDMPLNSYSSGMSARLGFALAVNVDPDILIIDEVFAVGDREFQQKSKQKTLEFFKKGKTVLFVSHSSSLLKEFCTRVIYLQDGFIEFDGEVEEGIEFYHTSLKNKSSTQAMILKKIYYDSGVIEMIFDIGFIYQNKVFKPLPLDELSIRLCKISRDKNLVYDIGFTEAHYEIIDDQTIKVLIHDHDVLNVGDFTLDFIDRTSKQKGDCFNFIGIDVIFADDKELNVDKSGGKLTLNLQEKEWSSEE